MSTNWCKVLKDFIGNSQRTMDSGEESSNINKNTFMLEHDYTQSSCSL